MMRKWKLYIPILLLFVCLLLFLGCNLGWFGVSFLEITPENLQFRDEAHDLALVPYYDEAEDAYFLFLPACTSPSDLTVSNSITGEAVPFSLIDVYQGAAKAAPDRAIELTVSGETYSISLWQCDRLPSLFLQGKPNMLSKVHADKQNKVTSQVRILDENGMVMLQEIGTLSGRGNGTWSDLGKGQAKRPYNLRFSNPISFGPFEDLTNLCLFAEYSDESKLRNSLAYFAGQALDIDYASPYAYINVYANGEYLGLYGITTKKEYTKHIGQDSIQAVFESTSIYNTPSFISDYYQQPMKVMYGDISHAQEVVRWFEAALAQGDWAQCEAVADLKSFALMYALQEFLCSVDMSYASQYFYVGQDYILHTMLPWDFDYSLGSAVTHFDPNQVRSVMAYRDLMGYSWYPVLLQWDGFRQQTANTMEQFFTDEFLETLNLHLLQDIQAIEASRNCDIRRWKTAAPFTDSPISSGMQTLPEFYDFFTEFFPKRRDFLLDYLQNYEEYCHITLQSQDGNWYNTIGIPKGSRPADYIDEADFLSRISPDNFSGLFLATPSGVPLAEVEAVTEDLTFLVTWH